MSPRLADVTANAGRALHVAVDARCLETSRATGTAKALRELVRRTAASGAIKWHLLSDRRHQSNWSPPHGDVDISILSNTIDRWLGWEQWSLPAEARRRTVDVLHAPDTAAPWWQPVPTVVTIPHTLSWWDDDPANPPGFYRDRLLPAAYLRASAIMTVSNTARRDILARWPALKPKLFVVSPGVDERYLEAQRDRRPIAIGDRIIEPPYLLYVGGPETHQRLAWAVQTWRGCSAGNLSLVACGIEMAAHDNVRRLVPREWQDRLILAPLVDDNDMPRLYIGATAVLYPSVGGGFGLPAIEAQAVGTPVLFSNVGTLAELQGPGAVVLPVDDLQSWVRAVDMIVQSRPPRNGPDRIARAWAAQYSWDSYVTRTLEVYDAAQARDVGQANSKSVLHHTTS